MGELLVEKSDFVATITLNRPERLNAISVPMLGALSEALVDADKDPEVRVVVLTGAGRGFCAGLDLQDQVSGEGIGSEKGVSAAVGRFDLRDAPPTVLHSLDKPTICALNGGAAGYGMDLALGCDIRIASEPGCCPGSSVGRRPARSCSRGERSRRNNVWSWNS